MRSTTTIVIGAGPGGLAISRCLSDRSIDHVVLERADVANSWRAERWDSLHLLTPNWMTRLPGSCYQGDDPDGFMAAGEIVDLLDDYAQRNAAPVRTATHVQAVTPTDRGGFTVTTNRDTWRCRTVVVATGACSTPKIPTIADAVPGHIHQLTPIRYRRPSDLPDGPVLVVGASSSGVQLAEELARAGRQVTLAVGSHTRLPRTYRGRDIHAWMEAIGLLDERYDNVADLPKVRRLPSLQLVGSPERRTLDLNALRSAGVELVGRITGISNDRAQCSGSLANTCADADLKMGRLLDQIDHLADTIGLPSSIRPERTVVPAPRTLVPLATYHTVIWATGFRQHHPYLDRRLLDQRGAVIHHGGVLPTPGIYVLGLPFLRRRKSSFLNGIGTDAHELADHLAHHLADQRATATHDS